MGDLIILGPFKILTLKRKSKAPGSHASVRPGLIPPSFRLLLDYTKGKVTSSGSNQRGRDASPDALFLIEGKKWPENVIFRTQVAAS